MRFCCRAWFCFIALLKWNADWLVLSVAGLSMTGFNAYCFTKCRNGARAPAATCSAHAHRGRPQMRPTFGQPCRKALRVLPCPLQAKQ